MGGLQQQWFFLNFPLKTVWNFFLSFLDPEQQSVKGSIIKTFISFVLFNKKGTEEKIQKSSTKTGPQEKKLLC